MTAGNARSRPNLGFIGTGLLGLPMALRLLEKGYALTVFDLYRAGIVPALEKGAREGKSPADVAAQSDVVLLCVTGTEAVEEVVFGAEGVAVGGASGKVLVDHSTTDAEKSRAFAGRLKQLTGMGWVDAPVSGGPQAAVEGTLAIMAGGEPADVEAVRAIMELLAKRFTHMGPAGAGQVAKMVNQVIAGVTFAVLAEAAKMAENAGLDATLIPECFAGGYADSTMLQRVYPRMVARDFTPAGFAKQMLKDLDMVAELARATKTPTPMAAQATNLYRLLIARGHGDVDTSGILKLYDAEPI